MNLEPILDSLQAVDSSDLDSVAAAAIELARQIQTRAKQLQTPAEKRQQAELDRMVQHPRDKATLTQMTDQAFRSDRAARAADQLVHILDVQGIPRFFSPVERTMLRGFQSFGGYMPGVAVPLVKEKMRLETANVILPAEAAPLSKHLSARQAEGVRMNVNFLGEAMLGEHEAQRRLETYLAALQMPEIECVSVKISTLYSQISTLSAQTTVRTVANRLELLYRAAQRNLFKRSDGSSTAKFVYLDMEEYRDMHLTAEVFMRTLERDGLADIDAGIALQAYVPDSYLIQQQLTQWARSRTANGGKPITIRIVKGANMEMERVEASQRGWPQAPYQRKIDTDANYKRMVVYGLQPENITSVRLGIASHNLFEVAFSIVLAAKQGSLEHLQFEMLEGMANHQRRALHELVDNLLLYAPACKQDDFIHAIGYLVRRMDENTGPDNFLRHAFKIEVDSPDWMKMEGIFTDSIKQLNCVSDQPRRQQDRRSTPEQPVASNDWRQLENEPDTDFSLPANISWAHQIVEDWKDKCNASATEIPLSIADSETFGTKQRESLDPSRPKTIAARYHVADAQQLQRAAECAIADPSGWQQISPDERYATLRRAAQEIRLARAQLLGSAMADAGKTLMEGDPEISEAVDFVEFYALTARDLQIDPRLAAKPRGPVVVISPWNFPIAIPCGGIAAALAAGNTVILKPASDTVLPASVICGCFWRAGVPREALQFVACSGSDASAHLLSHPHIKTVILTGGTETALRILEARPDLNLLAETGGKNATIVSSLSDRDLAIKNVLHSAFSHAGQKCSATSLLLLEEEVYHDRDFRDALVDAASSLTVGSAWDLRTKMGPLIRPPTGDLARGIKELESGETWALMARDLNDNPCLYSPGIKWNVSRGNFTHLTELFGPVLGVMPYRDLSEAIDLVHETGFGLTSGLESLDDREQEEWTRRLQAGNLYLNRPTTGAIVLRQPFGGMGKSAFGPGIKAGGPNYVVPLMQFASSDRQSTLTQPLSPSAAPALPALSAFWQHLHRQSKAANSVRAAMPKHEWSALLEAILDYDRFAAEEIRQEHDTLRLVGQDNFRRYQAMTHIRIRVAQSDSWLDIFARAAAVIAVGGRATISRSPGLQSAAIESLEQLTSEWAADMEFVEETEEELAEMIAAGQVDRVRYTSGVEVPTCIRKTADEHFIYVATTPVSLCGRVELLWYVREQSLCVDYHRYGNLGFRADEHRQDVL